ncbi:PhoX family protein [Salsipaludibacter albus]|uniref:PhoX family protein n=1 Tax=Salsipaludibacter albus TaxID=2849650 RepID=UPI001EE4257F|nr:alkaline phosphatase PhoX [Salsipaludibacter albus]MBY5163315.1 PhoX family protein [Salsipaludibacter albus]
MDRRTFLKGAGAAAGGALLGGPFAGFVARQAHAGPGPSFRDLGPVEDLRDGRVRLWLPDGFSYQSFHDNDGPEVVLDDGTSLPGRHDGMAALPGPNGDVWLVRNHEVNGNAPGGAFGPGTPYDGAALGGTTTTLVSPLGEVRESYTSLNGTQMNCSGGPMPWGAWITCEETVNGPDVGPDFTGTSNEDLEQPHGFVFEVPAGGQSDRQPIRQAGRFAHEAVAFDPVDGILYLTEDNFGFPSGFFRYLPPSDPMETGRLDDGGRLQMLAVVGRPNADLARAQPRRATFDVDWVDIDDPDPEFDPVVSNNDAIVYVGNQGRAGGAAWFSRLEGCVYDDNVVYFCSTQGGGEPEGQFGPVGDGFGNGRGQVWAYHTRGQTLQLVYESTGEEVLDFPDNVTTSPRGTLVLCEDGPADNHLRGLNRGGQIFDIAVNRLRRNDDPTVTRFGEEFAGTTFTADGHTLFVNIQASDGITFAIWGPWERIRV